MILYFSEKLSSITRGRSSGNKSLGPVNIVKLKEHPRIVISCQTLSSTNGFPFCIFKSPYQETDVL
jgi:hypothetical protein